MHSMNIHACIHTYRQNTHTHAVFKVNKPKRVWQKEKNTGQSKPGRPSLRATPVDQVSDQHDPAHWNANPVLSCLCEDTASCTATAPAPHLHVLTHMNPRFCHSYKAPEFHTDTLTAWGRARPKSWGGSMRGLVPTAAGSY